MYLGIIVKGCDESQQYSCLLVWSEFPMKQQHKMKLDFKLLLMVSFIHATNRFSEKHIFQL